MGERKGQNMYYPPDYDPRKGGLNKSQGTHALRERARKLHLGILIIRFEMPYNIWCDGCKNHIGMGVRYNAEKKKVGMYYTTPVYQFRMKCHLCDNHFEIKTDPANLDYEIISGARRQERRWDPTQNGQVVPETKETSRKLFDDAMFKLEHGDKDKAVAKDQKPRLKQLSQIQDRVKDDYLANRILRDKMRETRKAAKAQKATDSELLRKASLGSMELLPETEEDMRAASLLKYKSATTSEEKQASDRQSIADQDIFAKPPKAPSAASSSPGGGKATLEGLVARQRQREAVKRVSETLVTRKSLGIVARKKSKSSAGTVEVKDDEEEEGGGDASVTGGSRENSEVVEVKTEEEDEEQQASSEALSEPRAGPSHSQEDAEAAPSEPAAGPSTSGSTSDVGYAGLLKLCDYGSSSSSGNDSD